MILRKESNRRLLKLADHLDAIRPEFFDYSRWSSDDRQRNSCGSIGCALGHAVAIPEFRRLGLHFVVHVGGSVAPPKYGDLFGCSGAADLFGIPITDSLGLFTPYGAPGLDDSDATPEYVAQKIRDYVVMR